MDLCLVIFEQIELWWLIFAFFLCLAGKLVCVCVCAPGLCETSNLPVCTFVHWSLQHPVRRKSFPWVDFLVTVANHIAHLLSFWPIEIRWRLILCLIWFKRRNCLLPCGPTCSWASLSSLSWIVLWPTNRFLVNTFRFVSLKTRKAYPLKYPYISSIINCENILRKEKMSHFFLSWKLPQWTIWSWMANHCILKPWYRKQLVPSIENEYRSELCTQKDPPTMEDLWWRIRKSASIPKRKCSPRARLRTLRFDSRPSLVNEEARTLRLERSVDLVSSSTRNLPTTIYCQSIFQCFWSTIHSCLFISIMHKNETQEQIWRMVIIFGISSPSALRR